MADQVVWEMQDSKEHAIMILRCLVVQEVQELVEMMVEPELLVLAIMEVQVEPVDYLAVVVELEGQAVQAHKTASSVAHLVVM